MNEQRGFTLIEVLVAVFVLAVGMLGLAALQVTNIRNNQSAFNRSQATQLAYDLADRMRANTAGIATYTTIAVNAANAKAGCVTTAGCSAADMAENDLAEWFRAVNNADNLPSDGNAGTTDDNPQITISLAAGVYTIRLRWDDDRSGVLDGNDPTFDMSFQL